MQHLNQAEDHRWNAVLSEGLKCYAEGSLWLSDRPVSNLAELLGIGFHEGLNRMMRMSGLDEVYITGCASDYDKLEALFGVLPLWVGHPYHSAVHEVIAGLCNGGEPFLSNDLPRLWKTMAEKCLQDPLTHVSAANTWGITHMRISLPSETWMQLPQTCVSTEQKTCGLIIHDLISLWDPTASPLMRRVDQATATRDMTLALTDLVEGCVEKGCRSVTIDLTHLDSFVRPNPYGPGQAVYRLQKGENLSDEEKHLIMTQTLRILGDACVKHHLPWTLLHPSAEVLTPLCAYLKGCQCLPETCVTTMAPDQALLCGVTPLWEVDPVRAPEEQIATLAAQIPLGRLGGIYRPLKGLIDLPLMVKASQSLCAFFHDLENADATESDLRVQSEILKNILT